MASPADLDAVRPDGVARIPPAGGATEGPACRIVHGDGNVTPARWQLREVDALRRVTASAKADAGRQPSRNSSPDLLPSRRTLSQVVTTSSPKLLIVEDEADLVRTLEYNFRQAGFEVHTATSGREGLRHRRGQDARSGAARPHAPRHSGGRGVPAAQGGPEDARDAGHHPHGAGARRSTASSASRSAPTTTSPSRSACASSCFACAPCSAAASPRGGPPRC